MLLTEIEGYIDYTSTIIVSIVITEKAEDKMAEHNLYKLSDMTDYEVDKGDPDIRGWGVYSVDGMRLGTVDDLLVDKEKLKVRYLDIEVDDGIEGIEDERHLLIPVGAATLHEKEDRVDIKSISTVTLLKSPPYKGIVDRDYENSIRSTYWPERKIIITEDYYENEDYDETPFYEKRRGKL